MPTCKKIVLFRNKHWKIFKTSTWSERDRNLSPEAPRQTFVSRPNDGSSSRWVIYTKLSQVWLSPWTPKLPAPTHNWQVHGSNAWSITQAIGTLSRPLLKSSERTTRFTMLLLLEGVRFNTPTTDFLISSAHTMCKNLSSAGTLCSQELLPQKYLILPCLVDPLHCSHFHGCNLLNPTHGT